MTTAVVFGYHNVGVRCLSVLLAHEVEVKLVVTHEDAPGENIWFGSVRALAQQEGIPVIAPADPHEPKAFARIAAMKPDYLFSFYYRQMLKPELLKLAKLGAYNMHGSLLPKYRGRVPVNWAILRGEHETGATLHEMVRKPDAGRIVDQMAVPILPDDTALDVFRKVTVASEIVMHRSLPRLVGGNAALRAQDLAAGSYFGGRKPEDGRIDWREPARAIHDLVRAVAPPYPGAFSEIAGERVRLLRTRLLPERAAAGAAMLALDGSGRLVIECADGGRLEALALEMDGKALDGDALAHRFGRGPWRFGAA